MDFIGQNLHGHGQIERSVGRIGRNGHQSVAEREIRIAETDAFGPEHYRDPPSGRSNGHFPCKLALV